MKTGEKLIIFAALGAIIGLLLAHSADAHNRPGTRHNVEHAIAAGFCGTSHLPPRCARGRQATVVSLGCEARSGNPYAQNGQYKGIFQVSGHWRSTVRGFAWNVWAQARHAARVQALVGWSHWECAYRMGIL